MRMEANWIRRGRSKLRNTNGFTLSETLMTVVLIGLVTMAILGGIIAARNVYQRISLRADAQTLLATTVSALTEDLSSVTSCDVESSGQAQNSGKENAPTALTLIENGETKGLYFYAGSRGYRMQYENGNYSESDEKVIQVVPQLQSRVKIPLLPQKVQTRDLYAYIESLSVTMPQSGDGGYFTLRIQIKSSKKNDQIIEDAVVCIHNRMK